MSYNVDNDGNLRHYPKEVGIRQLGERRIKVVVELELSCKELDYQAEEAVKKCNIVKLVPCITCPLMSQTEEGRYTCAGQLYTILADETIRIEFGTIYDMREDCPLKLIDKDSDRVELDNVLVCKFRKNTWF